MIGLMLCSCAAANAADTSSMTEMTTQEVQTEITETAQKYTADETADAMMTAVEFPTMVKITADKAGEYLGTSIPEDLDFTMYICGSGGFADEIVLAKGSSLKQCDLVSAAKKRTEGRLEDFADYNPAESSKIENALILSNDNVFVCVISSDIDKCEDILAEKFLE